MPEPLTLTASPDLRRRMVTDTWLYLLRTQGLVVLPGVVVVGTVVLFLSHSPAAALATIGVLAVVRVGLWWARQTRAMRKRLPDGQVVSVGHTPTGDLVIRDTSEVWLPRGSIRSVVRIGSVTVLQGRAINTLVPTALLSDADAAFLEGHADGLPVSDRTDDALVLPLSTRITPRVQADLLHAYRRSFFASGEFGIVAAVPVLALVLSVLVGKTLTPLFLFVFLFCCFPAGLQLARVERVLSVVKDSFPVGHTLGARLDVDAMVLGFPHGALRLPWSRYQAHRLRPRTIELRTRKGRPLANTTLPLELFTPEALQVLRTHVPKAF